MSVPFNSPRRPGARPQPMDADFQAQTPPPSLAFPHENQSTQPDLVTADAMGLMFHGMETETEKMMVSAIQPVKEDVEKIRDTTNATAERLEALSRDTLERFNRHGQEAGSNFDVLDERTQHTDRAVTQHSTYFDQIEARLSRHDTMIQDSVVAQDRLRMSVLGGMQDVQQTVTILRAGCAGFIRVLDGTVDGFGHAMEQVANTNKMIDLQPSAVGTLLSVSGQAAVDAPPKADPSLDAQHPSEYATRSKTGSHVANPSTSSQAQGSKYRQTHPIATPYVPSMVNPARNHVGQPDQSIVVNANLPVNGPDVIAAQANFARTYAELRDRLGQADQNCPPPQRFRRGNKRIWRFLGRIKDKEVSKELQLFLATRFDEPTLVRRKAPGSASRASSGRHVCFPKLTWDQFDPAVREFINRKAY